MDRAAAETDRQIADVLDRALTDGPQRIVRPSGSLVVMRSEDYERLRSGRSALKRLLFEGPALEGLDISRDRSSPRAVDLDAP